MKCERVVGWVDSRTQTLGCAEVLDNTSTEGSDVALLGSLFWWIVILDSEQGFPSPSCCHLKMCLPGKTGLLPGTADTASLHRFENHY